MDTATRIDSIDFESAARRLHGVVRRTPLAACTRDGLGLDPGQPAVDLRLKLECLQETGSFKTRGAWNQISRLTAAERAAGVVATSSGNHGQALAWAARRGGVRATLYMPSDAYPNKVAACREYGAEVILSPTREEAERLCAEHVGRGGVLVHPFDSERTMEGAGTVGLEIAEDWPEVEVVVFPTGGGGLLSGSCLALRRRLGEAVRIFGVEPAGANSMTLGLAAGHSVPLPAVTSRVQGLCPTHSGALNVAVCSELLSRMFTLPDEEIFAAQARLVRETDLVVEPAGAAAAALVLGGHLPAELLAGRDASNPLRVAAVISGGNPAPDQLAAVRAGTAP